MSSVGSSGTAAEKAGRSKKLGALNIVQKTIRMGPPWSSALVFSNAIEPSDRGTIYWGPSKKQWTMQRQE